MRKLETYWCNAKPTLDDIKTAYDIVCSSDIAVRIDWFVPYNGMHSRIITREDVDRIPNYEVYFDEHIPHCYGV
jgi:hypothetical protein